MNSYRIMGIILGISSGIFAAEGEQSAQIKMLKEHLNAELAMLEASIAPATFLTNTRRGDACKKFAYHPESLTSDNYTRLVTHAIYASKKLVANQPLFDEGNEKLWFDTYATRLKMVEDHLLKFVHEESEGAFNRECYRIDTEIRTVETHIKCKRKHHDADSLYSLLGRVLTAKKDLQNIWGGLNEEWAKEKATKIDECVNKILRPEDPPPAPVQVAIATPVNAARARIRIPRRPLVDYPDDDATILPDVSLLLYPPAGPLDLPLNSADDENE